MSENWEPTYHKRNLANIEKLAPNTKLKAKQLYSYACRTGIDVLIYETIRSVEKQKENVRKGASQTMHSFHIVGQALDFVLIDDKGKEIWNGYSLPDVLNFVKYAKGLSFEWGGDWKGFVDKPHLQYVYKGYGTDKAAEPVKKEAVKPVPYKTVKKGDTLSSMFGKDWVRVAKLNKLQPPYTIQAGQKIQF